MEQLHAAGAHFQSGRESNLSPTPSGLPIDMNASGTTSTLDRSTRSALCSLLFHLPAQGRVRDDAPAGHEGDACPLKLANPKAFVRLERLER